MHLVMVGISQIGKIIGAQCRRFLQFHLKIESRCSLNPKRSKKVLISKFISLKTHFFLKNKRRLLNLTIFYYKSMKTDFHLLKKFALTFFKKLITLTFQFTVWPLVKIRYNIQLNLSVFLMM